MLKMHRVEVSQIKTIWLDPIKTEEIFLHKYCIYQYFYQQIKEKFDRFQRRSYLIFFPRLGGVDLCQHNFYEFLEKLEEQSVLYRQIHIQKIVQLSSIQIQPDIEYQTKLGPILEQLDSDEESNILEIILDFVFPNIDTTDPYISILDSDKIFMQNFGIITQDTSKFPLFSQLEEIIYAKIIRQLQTF